MDNFVLQRYTLLAGDNCCLSCGGAVDKSAVKLGETCVDLGCGRGNDVLRMAQLTGESGFVYGIDVTPAMLRKAEKSASKLGLINVKFILSSLDNIPIGDNIADLVISNCVINHIADKGKVWKEVYRILTKGGRFVVSDIYSLEPVPQEYSSDPMAVAECWAGSVTKDEYVDVIRETGFVEVEVIEESKPYAKGKIEVCSFTIKGFKN